MGIIIDGMAAGIGKGLADVGQVMLQDTLEKERNEAEFLRKKALGISERAAGQEYKTNERVSGQEFTAEQNRLNREAKSADIKTATQAKSSASKPNIKLIDPNKEVVEIGRDAGGNTVYRRVSEVGAPPPPIEDFQPTTEQLARLGEEYDKKDTGWFGNEHPSGLSRNNWIKRRAYEESTGKANPSGLVAGVMGDKSKPKSTSAPITYSSEADLIKAAKEGAKAKGYTEPTAAQLQDTIKKAREKGMLKDESLVKPKVETAPVKKITVEERISALEAKLNASDEAIKAVKGGLAGQGLIASKPKISNILGYVERKSIENELSKLKSSK